MAAVSAVTDLTASGIKNHCLLDVAKFVAALPQTREQAMADFLALSVFGGCP